MITLSVSDGELEDIRVGLKLLAIALAFPSKASRQFLMKVFEKPEIEMARFDQRHGEVQALLARLADLDRPAAGPLAGIEQPIGDQPDRDRPAGKFAAG